MREFINEMSKDYLIISYAEEYHTANHNKALQEITCYNVPKLTGEAWIHYEDLWYIKKGSKTYEKVKNQLNCNN